MESTAVIVSEVGGRQSQDAWRIITTLVLDGISSRHTRRADRRYGRRQSAAHVR